MSHTLLSLAHDAVEELAGLVHLSKVTDSLGADMVVVDLAAVLTAELAQGVPVPGRGITGMDIGPPPDTGKLVPGSGHLGSKELPVAAVN